MLPGISTEQLRSRLNRMVADGMLTRKRYREVPPRVDYELTERARELMPILGELARWGYEWAWSPPRPPKSVDLGAIFRLAPGLLGRPRPAASSSSWSTSPTGNPPTRSRSETTGVSVEEHAADTAPTPGSARPPTTWIKAFSPEHDRSGLDLSGEQPLASALLDGLSAIGRRAAARAAEAA